MCAHVRVHVWVFLLVVWLTCVHANEVNVLFSAIHSLYLSCCHASVNVSVVFRKRLHYSTHFRFNMIWICQIRQDGWKIRYISEAVNFATVECCLECNEFHSQTKKKYDEWKTNRKYSSFMQDETYAFGYRWSHFIDQNPETIYSKTNSCPSWMGEWGGEDRLKKEPTVINK